MNNTKKLTGPRGCVSRLVVRLPVSGPPLVPELAFPDGMEVFVGPQPGFYGRIHWAENPILSLPSKFHCGTDMRRDYGSCVPVRTRGLIGHVTWHNVRWVIPHNETSAGTDASGKTL